MESARLPGASRKCACFVPLSPTRSNFNHTLNRFIHRFTPLPRNAIGRTIAGSTLVGSELAPDRSPRRGEGHEPAVLPSATRTTRSGRSSACWPGTRSPWSADVRSIPWSQRFPWFRKELIAWSLKEAKIGYEFLGETLGGRPRDLADLDNAAERYREIAGQASFPGRPRQTGRRGGRSPDGDHVRRARPDRLPPGDADRARAARPRGGRDPAYPGQWRARAPRRPGSPHGREGQMRPPPLLDTPDMQQRAIEESYDILAHGPGWRPSG